MDKIQKVLIEQGRKDLAQEYYKKIATKVDFSSFDKNFDKMKASSSFEKSIYFHSGKNRRIELHHKDGKVLKGGGLIMGPGTSRKDRAAYCRRMLERIFDNNEKVPEIGNNFKFVVGNATYTSTSITFKVEIIDKAATGGITNKEEIEWKRVWGIIFDEAPIAQAHKVLISQGYELQKGKTEWKVLFKFKQ